MESLSRNFGNLINMTHLEDIIQRVKELSGQNEFLPAIEMALTSLEFIHAKIVEVESPPQEPPKKPVDMSVLIDSGIDVGYCGEERGEWLTPTSDDWTALALAKYRYKPRMNYWFSNANNYWGGIGIDAAVTKLVDAGFDVGVNKQSYAFRIHGLRDGYEWPWNIEVHDD